MREVKRQKEKGKRPEDGLRKRTPIPLVKTREIRVWNLCVSACIHPPQYCYGGRVCGPNAAFKIKGPSQNVRKTLKVNKGNLRVFSAKKFQIFLWALLWTIIGKSAKNLPKNHSNLPKKVAIFGVFARCINKSKCATKLPSTINQPATCLTPSVLIK
jgi:hypothetical protein